MDRLETVAAINDFLLQQVEHGKDTVLIIDEAQDLTEELLEQVRLLSNMETDDRKLLQIVLMGQPELRDRLNSPRLQAIAPAHHGALSSRAADAHRGRPIHPASPPSFRRANGGPNFTLPALWRVFRYSGGIPRLVNAVCDKALLAGFVQAVNASITPWSAAPSANWKGTYTHEP